MTVLPDGEFVEFLMYKDLQEDYIRSVKEGRRQIESKFSRDKDILKNSKTLEIEKDKRHRDLLSISAYPFHRKGSLAYTGYSLNRFDPLSELDEPNFDFLIIKYNDKHPSAIFGECKGTISDPDSVVSQSCKRREVVENNFDYVKQKYFSMDKSENVYCEYVIAVPDAEQAAMLKSVIDNDEPFIVWGAPITSKAYLTCAFPPNSVPEGKEKFMHRDHRLREALANKAVSNRKGFSYFRSSHTFARLTTLVYSSSPKGNIHFVDRNNLVSSIERDLFFEDESTRIIEANHLLEKGLEIGFLKPTPIPDQYELTPHVNSGTALERALLKKWLNNQLQLDLQKKMKHSREEIQDKYRAEKNKRPSIYKF